MSQHPQQVFCYFNNIFLAYPTNHFFSIFWVFIHHPSKFGSFSLKIDREIICQSWPFQTLFWPLCHSAMFQWHISASGYSNLKIGIFKFEYPNVSVVNLGVGIFKFENRDIQIWKSGFSNLKIGIFKFENKNDAV